MYDFLKLHKASHLVRLKSLKAGFWTIVCTRLLTLTLSSAAILTNNTRCSGYSRVEVATAQLPCASDINI